jgi:hypothetical protein
MIIRKKEMSDEGANKETKSSTRININSMLVGVAATVLFIVISFNPKILQENFWLSLQLVLIIPFLIISSLAYSKLGYKKEQKKWNLVAWVCFIIGYSFMINVIAILISIIGLVFIGATLITINLILHYIYAAMDHRYGDGSIREEFMKYAILTVLNVVLGLLVIFSSYTF